MRKSFILLLGLVLWCGCQKTSYPSPPTMTPEASVVPRLSDTPLEVRAYWEPMEGSDMETLASLPELGESFQNLSPIEPERTYPSEAFQSFLPKAPVKPGDVWALEEGAAETVLSQFYPNVQSHMNFDGSGAFAVLQGRSNSHWKIAVRIHAQFAYPNELYLSPASFEGHLLIDLKEERVQFLKLSVPRHHERNIAYEVHSGEFLTGLGLAPRMELVGGREEPAVYFDTEISDEKARETLAQQFFQFEEIDWLPLDQALKKAREERVPIFVVLIEGALTDQSC